MQISREFATQDTPLLFVSSMFSETMNLLEEAHAYFSLYGLRSLAGASPIEKMVYSAEMSRITLRLSSVMAWLLARRAECAGEISRVEAAEQFRLAFHDVCLEELPEMQCVLPQAMCSMIDRSLRLYRRAAHLDELIIADIEMTLH